jgi:hypothetical protein
MPEEEKYDVLEKIGAHTTTRFGPWICTDIEQAMGLSASFAR